MSEHPKFPNPTIQEALCELHVQRHPGSDWSPNKPTALIERLKPDYADFETITEQGVQLLLGPHGVLAPQALAPAIKLRFSHGQRPFLIHVTNELFSINVLKPYPGWPELKTELLNVWPLTAEVMGVAAIKRIGMRYINRIERRSADERPGAWLKAGRHIPEAFLGALPVSLLRLQVPSTKSSRTILTITQDMSQNSEPFGSLIVDIDRISEDQISPDAIELDQSLERLHDDVWELFSSAIDRRIGERWRVARGTRQPR